MGENIIVVQTIRNHEGVNVTLQTNQNLNRYEITNRS